jgi:hypothetical protein
MPKLDRLIHRALQFLRTDHTTPDDGDVLVSHRFQEASGSVSGCCIGSFKRPTNRCSTRYGTTLVTLRTTETSHLKRHRTRRLFDRDTLASESRYQCEMPHWTVVVPDDAPQRIGSNVHTSALRGGTPLKRCLLRMKIQVEHHRRYPVSVACCNAEADACTLRSPQRSRYTAQV